MNISDVIRKVKRVESLKGDAEAAHSLEDEIHQAVLEEIIKLGTDSQDPARDLRKAASLAYEALLTRDIKFARWTA